MIYPDYNPRELKPWYTSHILAMTEFNLVEKSDIAIQLAWRDRQIERLENAIENILQADERGQGLPFQEALTEAAKLIER